jgi:hypothetical protein
MLHKNGCGTENRQSMKRARSVVKIVVPTDTGVLRWLSSTVHFFLKSQTQYSSKIPRVAVFAKQVFVEVYDRSPSIS